MKGKVGFAILIGLVIIMGILAFKARAERNELLARADSLALISAHNDSVAAEATALARATADSLAAIQARTAIVLDSLSREKQEAVDRAEEWERRAQESLDNRVEAGETVVETIVRLKDASSGKAREVVEEAERQLYAYQETVAREYSDLMERIRAESDARAAAESIAMAVRSELEGTQVAYRAAEKRGEALAEEVESLKAENAVLRQIKDPGLLDDLWAHGRSFVAGGVVCVVLTFALVAL